MRHTIVLTMIGLSNSNKTRYQVGCQSRTNACIWGIEHFSVYLRGRKFTLYTDHKPLEKLSTVHTLSLIHI